MEYRAIDRQDNPETGFATFTVKTDDPVRLSSLVRGALPEDTSIGIWGGERGKYFFTVADVEVARQRLRQRGCNELKQLADLLPER